MCHIHMHTQVRATRHAPGAGPARELRRTLRVRIVEYTAHGSHLRTAPRAATQSGPSRLPGSSTSQSIARVSPPSSTNLGQLTKLKPVGMRSLSVHGPHIHTPASAARPLIIRRTPRATSVGQGSRVQGPHALLRQPPLRHSCAMQLLTASQPPRAWLRVGSCDAAAVTPRL